MKNKITQKSVKRLLLFFIISLFVSGLTALPIGQELSILVPFVPKNSLAGIWGMRVLKSYRFVQQHYPYLFYGYDWLAFAHFVLAILFIGPYKDPVKNIWVIQFGLIACVLVLPFAFIAGDVRGIPVWWRLIDCSFGVTGFAVLYPCYQKIKALARSTETITFSKPHIAVS